MSEGVEGESACASPSTPSLLRTLRGGWRRRRGEEGGGPLRESFRGGLLGGTSGKLEAMVPRGSPLPMPFVVLN
jgi:hypothetical protein